MAYDEKTAQRVRETLKRRRGVTEKKMFGGIAFMLNGNMCCGVLDKDLVLRLGDTAAATALKRPHTRPMDFTGRPMKTMVYVAATGFKTDDALKGWVTRAVEFAKSLPAK